MTSQGQFIARVVICTLAFVIVVVMCTLLYGLFDLRVDNRAIFAVIGPAFQSICGGFVGVLGTLMATMKKPNGDTQ